jgi:hypothetical protein
VVHPPLQALKSGQVALRMSVAARLSGHADEARFWTALPATLANVKTMQAALRQRQQQLSTGSTHLAPPSPAATTGSSLSAAAAAATGGMSPHLPAPTEVPAPAAAAAAAAAGDGPPDYDSFVRQALESSAAVAGSPVASPLGRRGSAAAVPGRVLYSGGSDAAQFSGQGPIKQVAAGV